MLNKNFWLRSILLVSSTVWLSLSFSSAALFTIDLGTSIEVLSSESLTKNIIPIHFVDNWNDFGWFLYTSSGTYAEITSPCIWDSDVCGKTVQFQDGVWYRCSRQVRWLYYNSQRWDRLWPLDDMTASSPVYEWVVTNGWLFTKCVSEDLPLALSGCVNLTGQDEKQCEADAWGSLGNFYGYYGMITHDYDWKQFWLIAGTQYSVEDPSWISLSLSGLAESFIRYENKYPVGLIFDYNGWVWFVWCEFTNGSAGLRSFVGVLNQWSGLDELFRETEEENLEYIGDVPVGLNCSWVGIATNSLINMVIEWLVWVGESSNVNLVWNQQNPKMQYFKSVSVNNSTLVNYTKQKAETLCRWKRVSYDNRQGDYIERVRNIGISIGISPDSNPDIWQWRYNKWVSLWIPTNLSTRLKWWEKQNMLWHGGAGVGLYNPLICIDGALGWDQGATVVAEPWFTYIVKGGLNVLVTPMMYYCNGEGSDGDVCHHDDDSYYYDVYILDNGWVPDYWNLILDSATELDMRSFTTDGFIALDGESSPEGVNLDYKTRIQQAVDEGESYHGHGESFDYAAMGAVIKWNFIINWHIKHLCNVNAGTCPLNETRVSNRYFVYWKLTAKDSLADLENLFSWRCDNWMSTNPYEVYCPQSTDNWKNPYENAPLVIIDQNYDSPVFG